jgi:hypothetical protein
MLKFHVMYNAILRREMVWEVVKIMMYFAVRKVGAMKLSSINVQDRRLRSYSHRSVQIVKFFVLYRLN